MLAALFAACGSSEKARENDRPPANAAGVVPSSTSSPRQESDDLAAALRQSDVLRRAQAVIDSQHPWRATQMLSSVVRDRPTPAATLVAARAAAGWGGWAEVDKLLAGESWLDSSFDGEGRELLAQSALERGVAAAALTNASAAVRAAKGNEARGTRLVLLARALERNKQFDSAAITYARAADLRPAIRDWLVLRVAGNQRDSVERAKTLGTITIAAAKPRVPWTDAQARERFGDAAGAAARYASLGATVSSLRLRLSVTTDPAARDAIKRQLLAIVVAQPASANARTATDVLETFATFSPSDALSIARSAMLLGQAPRAISYYQRANTQPSLLTQTDRLQYGQTLARAGRSRDALAEFALVQGPLAAQANYLKARVLLTSSTREATQAALRDVVTRFPANAEIASAALYLLADLSTDAGNDAEARSMFQRLYHEYPKNSRAASARFLAAMIAFTAGDPASAGRELDSLVALYPRADDLLASRYWSGRAWEQAGNSALAQTRWRDLVDQQPATYYGFASAKRLGETGWMPSRATSAPARDTSIDDALERAASLEALGMDTEARFEYDALDRIAATSRDKALVVAYAYALHGQPSRAIRIAQRFSDGSLRDAGLYDVLFPVLDRDELTRTAAANGLDPALVAGLIRQESNFNPNAVSGANARGLMQVLPNVGESLARSLKYPVWSSALLFDPDANLQLGTAHLAAFFKQYGVLPRVLAAYNAGGSRVARWSTKVGMQDPDVFTERIPFVETRDYVRLVTRNAEIYRRLLAASRTSSAAPD